MFKPGEIPQAPKKTSKLLTVEGAQAVLDAQEQTTKTPGIERNLTLEETRHKLFLFGKAQEVLAGMANRDFIFEKKNTADQKAAELNTLFGMTIASVEDLPRIGIDNQTEFPVYINSLLMKEAYKEILDSENNIKPEYRSIAA